MRAGGRSVRGELGSLQGSADGTGRGGAPQRGSRDASPRGGQTVDSGATGRTRERRGLSTRVFDGLIGADRSGSGRIGADRGGSGRREIFDLTSERKPNQRNQTNNRMSLIRYQPYQTTELAPGTPLDRLAGLRDEMNRLFDFSLPARETGFFGAWTPNLDVYDDREMFVVLCELPGMTREEVNVSFQDGVLTISGERKPAQEPERGEVFRSERYFGKFQRTVSLPGGVDADRVSATYTDGVLRVALPKLEAAKLRQIPVGAA